MAPYAVLILCLLLGAYLLGRWYETAQPSTVVKVVKWALLTLGSLAGLAFLFLRRPDLLFLTIALFLPLIMNTRALRNRMKAARGASPGGTSEVNTRFLRMTLDHDSGEMDGEVLEGRLTGRRLSGLTPEEMLALWRECRAKDPQSAAVLEAYMDRSLGDSWREAAAENGQGGPGPRPGGDMSEEEAWETLGLEPGADRDEIIEAHRRLMQRVHPDHGGSNYLAAKINQAKDLLLAKHG